MHSIVKGLLVAAGIVGASFTATAATQASTTVKVSLTDQGAEKEMPTGLGYNMGGDMSKATMFVKTDKKEVPAGKVTFDVTNESKDTVHEVIVGYLKDPKAKLPYSKADSAVEEEGSAHLGEVSELDPGKSGSLTVDLKPGLYILYCNVPGHYMAGMWTLLTVK